MNKNKMATPLIPRRTVIRSLFGGSLLMPGVFSELLAEDNPTGTRPPHRSAPAKSVIFIYATGGVSHIDTFDPKPATKGRDGTGKDKLMGNIFGAKPNPRCGPRSAISSPMCAT